MAAIQPDEERKEGEIEDKDRKTNGARIKKRKKESWFNEIMFRFTGALNVFY